MGYDPKLLYGNEQIRLDTHPSWIMMVRSVIYVTGAVVVGVLLWSWDLPGNVIGTLLSYAGIALILLALLHLGQRLIRWYSTNFVITTERCIYREGIISKRGIEIPLDRINTIFFHQRLFERVFGAGTLHIESAGELGIQKFQDVRHPMDVQNLLYQAMEDNESRRYERMGESAASAAEHSAPVVGAAPLSVADELAKLVDLRDDGHLTPEEFEQQKAALLGTGGAPPVAPPLSPPSSPPQP